MPQFIRLFHVVGKEERTSGNCDDAIIHYCSLCFIQFSHVFYTSFRFCCCCPFLLAYVTDLLRISCLVCELTIVDGVLCTNSLLSDSCHLTLLLHFWSTSATRRQYSVNTRVR